jgi:aspartate kinase
MEVFKFGGASVKDAESIRKIPQILELYNNTELVIVISAMGKTTNAMERITNAYFSGSESLSSEINKIEKYHFDIINELFPDKTNPVYHDICNTFDNIKSYVKQNPSDNYDHEYDRIVSNGEILSSKILNHYLNFCGIESQWLDITQIIITDDQHRNATVNWIKTIECVDKILVPAMKSCKKTVVQGFIGRAENNEIVTLGREGSDYSASIIAFCLNAVRVTIWKDVPGVLNADPKYFDETVKIDELSYLDAVELAYYGASVIHPKTIKPLENKRIPLIVRSFVEPSAEGTSIHSNTQKLPVPMFIVKKDQILISIYPNDFSFIAEDNLRDIFHVFAKYNTGINLMQNTAISFSVVADNDTFKIEKILSELRKQFKVKYNGGLELITIRNYNRATIDRITSGAEILIEQKTRMNAQLVIRRK